MPSTDLFCLLLTKNFYSGYCFNSILQMKKVRLESLRLYSNWIVKLRFLPRSFWFQSSINTLMLCLRDEKSRGDALHKTNLRCPRTTLLFQIRFLFSIPKTTHKASEGIDYLMFMHVTLEKWGFQMPLINTLAEENISPKLLTEEPVLPAPTSPQTYRNLHPASIYNGALDTTLLVYLSYAFDQSKW